VIMTKTRHFQGVRDATAGFFSQGLNCRAGVIVRYQDRVFPFQALFHPGQQFTLAQRIQLGALGMIQVGLHLKANFLQFV